MISTILLAAAAASVPVPQASSARTSLVLITLDTTRADHLGCYGASSAATPNLDTLARHGVRFTAAVSPVPLTLPAHASLMSGRVPRRHGLRDNAGFKLDPAVPLLAERLRAAGYQTAAFVSSMVLDREGGLDRGFATYDDTVRIGDPRAFNYEERAASQTVDAVLKQIGALTAPYFLWVHFYDPHAPYVPPEPYTTRFAKAPYDGEIAFMDAQLGRLLDAIKRRGDTPLVVAAGDHGESLGEHGEDGHGVFLYEATQHVPLIFSGPGLPTGVTVSATVGLVDVAPTVLDLLKLAPLPEPDGRSLAPSMRGARFASPDYEMETLYPSMSFGWAPLHALRSGPYKYVAAPRPELYELATDPRETHDLVARQPARASSLAGSLTARTGSDPDRVASASDPDTEERRERLASLGYVSGSRAPESGALDPKDGVVLLRELDTASRAVQLGDPHDAFAPLARLLAKNPTNIPARLQLGQAQQATGQTDEAIATYRAVAEMVPGNPMGWFDLGSALVQKALKDDTAYADAKRAFERSLALSPRHADTYTNLAALQAARHEPEESRKTLLRARAAGVADPTIETELGLLEAARKDLTAARAAFARALELNPRQPEALEALGRLAYAAGDFALAADYYDRALAARPDAATAKTLGAIRLYHLNDGAGALAAFSRALALLKPDDPDAADLRALVKDLGK